MKEYDFNMNTRSKASELASDDTSICTRIRICPNTILAYTRLTTLHCNARLAYQACGSRLTHNARMMWKKTTATPQRNKQHHNRSVSNHDNKL